LTTFGAQSHDIGNKRERLPTDVTADNPLLSGETADSNDRDDAEHWVVVYEELTALLSASDPPDGMLERYRQRLQFWRCRRDELAGLAGADGQSSKVVE
jgi:hypothetical protein